MTKFQLIQENEKLIEANERLTRQLLHAIETNKAAMSQLQAQTGRAVYTHRDFTGVAIPLTREQESYVCNNIHEIVCDSADGYGYNQTKVIEPWKEKLLPNFSHYVVNFDYTDHDGISISRVWGLVAVK